MASKVEDESKTRKDLGEARDRIRENSPELYAALVERFEATRESQFTHAHRAVSVICGLLDDIADLERDTSSGAAAQRIQECAEVFAGELSPRLVVERFVAKLERGNTEDVTRLQLRGLLAFIPGADQRVTDAMLDALVEEWPDELPGSHHGGGGKFDRLADVVRGALNLPDLKAATVERYARAALARLRDVDE